jgi:hypothetical protein
MKASFKPLDRASTMVFVLQHLESGEYVCLHHNGIDYLVAFTKPDDATLFRRDAGLIEHAQIVSVRLDGTSFEHFWLDGEMVNRATLR